MHSPQTALLPVVPNYPAQPHQPTAFVDPATEGAAITASSLLNRHSQNQNRPSMQAKNALEDGGIGRSGSPSEKIQTSAEDRRSPLDSTQGTTGPRAHPHLVS